MKNFKTQNFSILGVEEMFNVRGGDGNDTTTSTTVVVKHNSTAEGIDKDIIL